MSIAEKEQTHYLCPFCWVSFEEHEDLKNHVLLNHKRDPVVRPEGQISLSINKKDYRLQVESEWTLYYLIHDRLGLIGAKQFCDRGACGSCTVIMEGRPILSCMTLAIECDGKKIETIEGIADDDHPLIETYAKHHAMQCGYCTPGFVVTAKALLDRKSEPGLDEIKQALAGNLCRCGTYPQHPIAVEEAAQIINSGQSRERFTVKAEQTELKSLAEMAQEAREQMQEGGSDEQ